MGLAEIFRNDIFLLRTDKVIMYTLRNFFPYTYNTHFLFCFVIKDFNRRELITESLVSTRG